MELFELVSMYFVSFQKLDQFLRNILSKRPLSEMNQTIFRCANCATQFSRENLLRNLGESLALQLLTRCPLSRLLNDSHSLNH